MRLFLAGFVAVALLVGGSDLRADDDAMVSGIVQDGLLHPLEGATVVIHSSSGATVGRARTTSDGRFKFPTIPAGDYTIEASAPGLIGDHQHVQVAAAPLTVDLTLVSGEEVVTIDEDWAVSPPAPVTGSVTSVSRQTLGELPGGDARPVTDILATQPGFVADGLGSVYARGNHGNVQYQIDGIAVPDSVGSLFAASIPTRLIDSLDIYTGGMPAEFGNRLGAVVNLSTRMATDRPEGDVQVRYGSYNTIEPGATYSAKITDHIGAFGGVSVLHSQRFLDPPSIDPILHDAGTSARAFARVDYAPNDADRYELFATFAHTQFQIPLDPSAEVFDPAVPRLPDHYGNPAPAFVPHDTDATETDDELFAMVAISHKFERGKLLVAPLYKLSRGVLNGDVAHALGPTADPGAVASGVTRLAHHAGFIARYSVAADCHLLTAGIQLDAQYGATTFKTETRAAGGGVDPAQTVTGRDHLRAMTSGGYVQDHIGLGKLLIDAGVRFDEFHVILADGSTRDAFGAGPRLGASYAIANDMVAHAFTGVNWLPPAPLDASNAARALGIAAGPYDVKPETNFYAETGLASRIGKALRAGAVAWGRYAFNQLDDTSIGSTGIVSNYNFERGRAGGVEVNADVRVGPWLSAFANASLGFAQGRGIASAKFLFDAEALAESGWQQLDHAQTLTANGGVTIRNGRFEISGLVAYGSGLRTGASNTAHVPGHVRGDVAMRYSFAPGGYPIRVGVDVINVADARYAYRIANGFVGSSYGAPRSVFLSLSVPLAAEQRASR